MHHPLQRGDLADLQRCRHRCKLRCSPSRRSLSSGCPPACSLTDIELPAVDFTSCTSKIRISTSTRRLAREPNCLIPTSDPRSASELHNEGSSLRANALPRKLPGAGSLIYRGLATVIVGGMAISTLFTLFLLPALLQLGAARATALSSKTFHAATQPAE